jgi:hypothetical protein
MSVEDVATFTRERIEALWPDAFLHDGHDENVCT